MNNLKQALKDWQKFYFIAHRKFEKAMRIANELYPGEFKNTALKESLNERKKMDNPSAA